MKYCTALVGNSSSGIIEGDYFGTFVINIGIRQLGRERGRNVMDINSFSEPLISKALKKALKMSNKKTKIASIYGDGNTSKIIVKFLEKLSISDDLIKKQLTY